MSRKDPEPFTDVTFRGDFPRQSVADHEVFLSFNGDSQAEAFHDWWDDEGAVQFQDWLNREADRAKADS